MVCGHALTHGKWCSPAQCLRALLTWRFRLALPRPDSGFPITSLGLAELLPIGFGCGELLSRFGRLLFSRKDVIGFFIEVRAPSGL